MGEATESDKPFIASVRELMADSTRHSSRPAALHRWRRRISRLRCRGMVRAGHAAGNQRLRRGSWLHALRHRARLRSRATPDPHHRKRQDHGRRGPRVALSVRLNKIEFVERELERTLSKRRSDPMRILDHLERQPRAVRADGAHRERTSPLATSIRSSCRSDSKRRSRPIRSRSIARCDT